MYPQCTRVKTSLALKKVFYNGGITQQLATLVFKPKTLKVNKGQSAAVRPPEETPGGATFHHCFLSAGTSAGEQTRTCKSAAA